MKIIWRTVIILIAAGLILSLLGIAMGASRWVYWNRSGSHIVGSEEEKSITEHGLEPIRNIDISADFTDVEFIRSDQYGFDIRYYAADVSWSLDNGNLQIKLSTQKTTRNDGRRFFDINLSFTYPSRNIKVYLPADAELGNVSVTIDSGDIKAGGFLADDVQIRNSFGRLDIHSIACQKLQIVMDSGDFSGKDLSVSKDIAYKNHFGASKFETVSAGNFSIDSNSGDVAINGCLVEGINIKTSFGEMTAVHLRSSKTDIDANSAEINVSGTFSGQTRINNHFGEVRFATTKAREEYTYEISADFGNVTIDNNLGGSSMYGGNSEENSLYITNSSGDVQVRFSM